MKFVGNSGHSRIDPGAVDPIQLEERDHIHTEEAKWCKEVMEMACYKMESKGHQVQFVQDDSLETVCDVANKFGADVFVSLHLNAATNTGAQGPETYYLKGSKKGERLANCVHSQLVQKLGAHGRDRGVKQAAFYVLLNTDAPAILIEVGFITNVWEEQQLNEAWVKTAVSDAIVEGVLNYGREV